MPRLTLQIKETEHKIPRFHKKETYVECNDPSEFKLLTDNRHENEKFSRIDKYWVTHSWEVSIDLWASETIFYPSPYGMELIKEMTANEHGRRNPLIRRFKKLITTGISRSGKQEIPNIDVKRVKLECKPENRMRLLCKD